jgi:hypothetical protein
LGSICSNQCSFGADGQVHSVPNATGIQQGSVAGPFNYGITKYKFFKGMQTLLESFPNSESFAKSYLDDGSLVLNTELLAVIAYIVAEGPRVGYWMNFIKSQLLIGECDTH